MGDPAPIGVDRCRPGAPGRVSRRGFLALAAAAPLVLRTGRASALPAPRALVTCDTESRIALVDIGAGRVLRSIPVLPGPRSVERVGSGRALVCHTVAGAVSILDAATGSVRHVLHELTEPRYAARHPDGMHAFVTDSGRELVASVDIRRGTVLGTARLDGWARHVSLSPDARTLWIGLGTVARHVAVVDVSTPARPRLVRTLTPPFLAHDVGFSPDGRHVWVTAGEDGATAVYTSGGRLRFRLPADPGPQHVTFGDVVVYVTSGVAGTFRVHSLRDGRTIREAKVPVGSYNVQSGPGGLVLTPSLDRGTLSVLAPDGRVLREVAVAASTHDACFAA
jgi:DNA-binding beta-propeller fold protein YncE